MKNFVIQTPRLLLRTWTLEDVEDGLSIWGDPEVMKFIDTGQSQNLEQVRTSIQAGIRHQEKFGFQHWAVIEKQSQKLIGACGFNSTEQSQVIELVFHFAKAFWKKGYATEAVRACIQFAFEQIKPLKIIAGCHPNNEASKKVLEKCDFLFTGNEWFEDTRREEPCFELQPSSMLRH